MESFETSWFGCALQASYHVTMMMHAPTCRSRSERLKQLLSPACHVTEDGVSTPVDGLGGTKNKKPNKAKQSDAERCNGSKVPSFSKIVAPYPAQTMATSPGQPHKDKRHENTEDYNNINSNNNNRISGWSSACSNKKPGTVQYTRWHSSFVTPDTLFFPVAVAAAPASWLLLLRLFGSLLLPSLQSPPGLLGLTLVSVPRNEGSREESAWSIGEKIDVTVHDYKLQFHITARQNGDKISLYNRAGSDNTGVIV